MVGIVERISDSSSGTIYSVIQDHAERWPDRPAIVASGLDPLSFRDLIGTVDDVWEVLRAGGVSPGTRIGILLPSGIESILSTVSITSRATCVPFNPNLSERELLSQLTRPNLDLDALIIPAWFTLPALDAAEDAAFPLFVASKVSKGQPRFSLECIHRNGRPRGAAATVSSQTSALILSTSATTGPPKLVPVTNGNMLDLADKMAASFGLSFEDRAACVLPTYYAAGAKLNILVPLLLGESIAVPIGVPREHLARWVSDLRPTWFSAGPTFLQAVLDRLKADGGPLSNNTLRFITAGAAHLPSQLRCELESALDCPILEVYGISEAGVMAANPAPPGKRKPGSVGLICKGELEVRGPDGNVLPPGVAGEIYVGGPGVMPGYIDGSEEGRAALQEDWFRTGDIGQVDADGFLTLVGRVKEVINRGGEKISPYEIESALLVHPSVSEAAVFPVPHPRLGENVAASVVLKPEHTINADELRGFLSDHIASFKVPQHIDIVSSLPKGHTGKILRTQLAQAARSGSRKVDPPENPLEFQILEIWRRLLDRSDIGVNDNFFEAGGDSLLATEMICDVEAAIGRSVPHSAIVPIFSIRQIATMIAQDRSAEDLPITKIKLGNGIPFFYCHGDFGTYGFYALKFAELIETDQPIYLVHPPRYVDQNFSIEEMAERYVRHLLELHPDGRVQLGGHCNGGLLAWEIANQLERAGKEVESVTLIDVLSLNSRALFRTTSSLLRSISKAVFRTRAEYLRRNGMAEFWNAARLEDLHVPLKRNQRRLWPKVIDPAIWRVRARVARQLVAILVRPAHKDSSHAITLPMPALGQSYRRDRRYFQAMSNYIPKKLRCNLNVIVCEENADAFCFAPTVWNHLARGVRRATVPGEHLTCITVHVQTLAQMLSKFLGSCTAGAADQEPQALRRT